jgi:hypothetical protein
MGFSGQFARQQWRRADVACERLSCRPSGLGELIGNRRPALTTETVLPWGGLLRAQGYVGALGYWRIGGDDVSALLLGQGLAFAVPGKDQAAGWYTGAGVDISVARAVRVFGEAQAIWLNDESRTLTGRGGVKVAF